MYSVLITALYMFATVTVAVAMDSVVALCE
jgi:hypothetical protein